MKVVAGKRAMTSTEIVFAAGNIARNSRRPTAPPPDFPQHCIGYRSECLPGCGATGKLSVGKLFDR